MPKVAGSILEPADFSDINFTSLWTLFPAAAIFKGFKGKKRLRLGIISKIQANI